MTATAKTSLSDLQKKTSKEIAELKPKDQVKTLLAQNAAAIAKILPKHVTPDRMMQVALTAFTSTPALQECYVPSLIGAVVQSASMGLEPNTVLGHAYLLPFKNKKKNRTDCQLIIGYRGMIDLARRSGEIVSINAHVVREGDDFSYEYGLDEHLRHVPSEDEHGDITHAYAIAHLKGGGHVFEVMTRKQIDEVRAMSKSGNYGPWKDHFEAMARKSVIRRLSKYLPMSVQMAMAVDTDEKADRNEQDFGSIFEGDFTTEGVDPVGDASFDDDEVVAEQEDDKKPSSPKKKAAVKKKRAKPAGDDAISME